MPYRYAVYGCADGTTRELGTAATLAQAKAAVAAQPAALASGLTDWEGPAHRGGQLITWTLYAPQAELTYVIELQRQPAPQGEVAPSSPAVAELAARIAAQPALREHVVATLADGWANRGWDEAELHEVALHGFRGYASLRSLELAEALVAAYADMGTDYSCEMLLTMIQWED